MNQEKRNTRLLISLLLLTTGAITVFFLQQREAPAAVDARIFKVEDPAKIDHVLLESVKGTVKLNFDGTRWRVNDRYDADRRMVDVLFATLEGAVPKRSVAASRRDSVNDRLKSDGITVSLFEGTAIKMKFQAGGNIQKDEAYFKLPESSGGYVMTIPGYRVYVSQIFDLDENGWRDKRIFNFSWINFSRLQAAFPSGPESDFTISRQNRLLTILGMEKADTARIMTYVDDVSLLAADQIISPGSSKSYDSLAQTTPALSIEIRDIANRAYRLTLFTPTKGEAMILGKGLEDDLVLFDRKKIFRVIKKKAYFKLQDH